MRSHTADIVSLVTGAVFMLVAVLGMSGLTWTWGVQARWLLPLALVGFGLIGLAVVLGRREHSEDTEHSHPVQ